MGQNNQPKPSFIGPAPRRRFAGSEPTILTEEAATPTEGPSWKRLLAGTATRLGGGIGGPLLGGALGGAWLGPPGMVGGGIIGALLGGGGGDAAAQLIEKNTTDPSQINLTQSGIEAGLSAVPVGGLLKGVRHPLLAAAGLGAGMSQVGLSGHRLSRGESPIPQSGDLPYLALGGLFGMGGQALASRWAARGERGGVAPAPDGPPTPSAPKPPRVEQAGGRQILEAPPNFPTRSLSTRLAARPLEPVPSMAEAQSTITGTLSGPASRIAKANTARIQGDLDVGVATGRAPSTTRALDPTRSLITELLEPPGSAIADPTRLAPEDLAQLGPRGSVVASAIPDIEPPSAATTAALRAQGMQRSPNRALAAAQRAEAQASRAEELADIARQRQVQQATELAARQAQIAAAREGLETGRQTVRTSVSATDPTGTQSLTQSFTPPKPPPPGTVRLEDEVIGTPTPPVGGARVRSVTPLDPPPAGAQPTQPVWAKTGTPERALYDRWKLAGASHTDAVINTTAGKEPPAPLAGPSRVSGAQPPEAPPTAVPVVAPRTPLPPTPPAGDAIPLSPEAPPTGDFQGRVSAVSLAPEAPAAPTQPPLAPQGQATLPLEVPVAPPAQQVAPAPPPVVAAPAPAPPVGAAPPPPPPASRINPSLRAGLLRKGMNDDAINAFEAELAGGGGDPALVNLVNRSEAYNKLLNSRRAGFKINEDERRAAARAMMEASEAAGIPPTPQIRAEAPAPTPPRGRGRPPKAGPVLSPEEGAAAARQVEVDRAISQKEAAWRYIQSQTDPDLPQTLDDFIASQRNQWATPADFERFKSALQASAPTNPPVNKVPPVTPPVEALTPPGSVAPRVRQPRKPRGAAGVLSKFVKGTEGEISREAAIRLALAGAGGVAGYNLYEDDPVMGALMGAGAGYALPSVFGRMASKLQGTSLDDAGSAVAKYIPKIQRFNYLNSLSSLAANSVAGPWGSGFWEGAERAIGGADVNERAIGRGIIADRLKPSYLKGIWSHMREASDKLRLSDDFRHEMGLGANPSKADYVLASPGIAMTAGDLNEVSTLVGRGLTVPEARAVTMTGEPWSRSGKGVVNFGRQAGVLGKMSLPFAKTLANIFEEGAQRTPGVGIAVQRARQHMTGRPMDSFRMQAAQQGLGALVTALGYTAGQQTDPTQATMVRKFVSNLGGRYSLLANAGFAAGQANRRGKPPLEAAAGSMMGDFPLPSSRAFTDLLGVLKGQWPRMAWPGFADNMIARPGTKPNQGEATNPLEFFGSFREPTSRQGIQSLFDENGNPLF